MKTSMRHEDRHKHKHALNHSPCKHKLKAEQKAKQRKILVVLSSQVPEEKSCFVFLAYMLIRCKPGFSQLVNSFASPCSV